MNDSTIPIPKRIREINSYQPGKTIPQLQEEYGWEKVSILWNNENTLGFSEKSKKAVIEAYEQVNYYPDPLAIDLRTRLAEKHDRSIDEIILGNGSESVLMLAIKAICEPNDEFLTSQGAFVIVYNWAKINNVVPVATPLTSEYEFDLEAIKSKVNPNTRMIYLANVNNPTGTMIGKGDLITFIESIPQDILIIIDEAYFEFSRSLSDEFPDSLEFDYPNILTLRTFSKAYGIAGVRLGYGIGNSDVIASMMKAKLTFEPTLLAQAAGIGALDDEEFLQKTINNNLEQLPILEQGLKKLSIPFVKSYGNFVLSVWKDELQARSIFEQLMKRGVLVRPMAGALANTIRISVGRPDENMHLLNSLEQIRAKKLY
jgi:histidinol-phosphate aminotransferase